MNVFQKRFSFARGDKRGKERSGERIVYNLTSVRQILNPTYYMQMSHEKKNENERVKEKGRKRKIKRE